MTFPRSAAD